MERIGFSHWHAIFFIPMHYNANTCIETLQYVVKVNKVSCFYEVYKNKQN